LSTSKGFAVPSLGGGETYWVEVTYPPASGTATVCVNAAAKLVNQQELNPAKQASNCGPM
jgi:hypothetical protein